MPKIPLIEFTETIQTRFPKLKGYDETRIFSLLMDAGVNIQFDFDQDGNTMVSYDEISDAAAAKLSAL
ncbi:MAG TPA: hypothetical protein VNN76_07320 [Bacteroidota bacterium]|nr:hypothetical protein [Bacteroidota bacterium]